MNVQTPPGAAIDHPTPTYLEMGGIEGCITLATLFYRRVETDPVLLPMYPRHLKCAIDNLAHFLAYLAGGPSDYMGRQMSRPRLQASHRRFRIGVVESDAWVRHMRGAVDEAGYPEPLRVALHRYFADAAASLINTPDNNSAAAGPTTETRHEPTDPHPLDEAWARIQAVEKIFDEVDAGGVSKLIAGLDAGLVDREEMLLYAANIGQRAIVDRLLDAGADASKLVVYGPMLIDHLEIADHLLAHGASVNDARGKRPPLVEACRGDKREKPELVRMLLDRGADVNGITRQGLTALHYAARAGFLRTVELLLDHGAAVNAVGEDGITPLLSAVQRGRTAVVAKLLAAGADPGMSLTRTGQTSLHLAAKAGNQEIAAMLLDYGAPPQPSMARAVTPE